MAFDRTGLDPVENAILATLDAVGAPPDASHRKTSYVLDEVNDRYGYAQDDILARILGLSRPWLTALRLIDFHGNYGARSFEAASPRYTEIRLTTLGLASAHASAGVGPALPLGLVLGDTYKGGRRPPHDPQRIAEAMHLVGDGADEATVVHRVGCPAFPAGCHVRGDLEALRRGEAVRLTLTATVTQLNERTLEITDLPPGSSESELCQRFSQLAASLPVVEVKDCSTGHETKLRVGAKSTSDMGAIRQAVLDVWGVHRFIECSYGMPLAELLRDWVRHEGGQLEGLSKLIDE